MYVCVCVYIYIYISAIKKNETLPFVTTYMDLERMMLSEMGQRERHILHGNHLHMESGKKFKKHQKEVPKPNQ